MCDTVSRRRLFTAIAGAAAAGMALSKAPGAPVEGAKTNFQIGCMTLPFSAFPFTESIQAIRRAGNRYVAWGTRHAGPGGKPAELLEVDDAPSKAAMLAKQCRDAGLDPVMLFARVYVGDANSIDAHTKRIKQAAAGGLKFVLTFGHIEKGGHAEWIRNLKTLGPIARDNGVAIVIKQHGGNTATGQDCSRIIAETADEGVGMCYDAGNVLDYENQDPIADINACWRDVRAFAIKDHRNWPQDQDCGPGFGEIDHYRLLTPVANTGLDMPLVCENIFEPLVARPSTIEGVEQLARRAREYLESVVAGVQTPRKDEGD
jgi:sugar phosphate isomerase/epimerase